VSENGRISVRRIRITPIVTAARTEDARIGSDPKRPRYRRPTVKSAASDTQRGPGSRRGRLDLSRPSIDRRLIPTGSVIGPLVVLPCEGFAVTERL